MAEVGVLVAAKVGGSVAAKLAEYLVHPILKKLQYLFCVGKISRNVQIRKEELMLQQRRVLELVQEAINRTDRIDSEVDKWKNDVESLIAEVENLEEQLRANNGCLQGWCPCWTTYHLCKMLDDRTQRMIHLITKSDHFNPFSHPVTVPDIEYHSSKNFKFFNSTRMAFDELWKALHDDGNSIIGLWGMGGSGKTTLAMEVGKKAKESQLFDRVVLTTISQSLNIRKIQGEIADTLGLELKEESEIGRAKRISLRLQNGERNLIIVDDVWAKLNLEDIGIPIVQNHQRSCKVVLTTRRLDVCTLMECQQKIRLNLLEEDEAWVLFQTHANVNDAAKEVVAWEIVVECKGLPIAIVAMGSCLNGKGDNEMNVMLYRLRNAKPNIVDKGVRNAFACLELSYDYLATQEAKLLLLMCAMFPDNHKIDVEDLFRYGVGLGLCEDVDSFEIIRSQVRATIKYLIDSSLLIPSSLKFSEGQEYVTMHDVVRDFALWKSSKEEHTIIVNCTKELNKLIDNEGVKDCYAASSWYVKENDLFELFLFPSQLDAPKFEFQLDAPKLKLLMLHSRTLFEISHASFEGAKELRALIIIMDPYLRKMEVQPQSIKWLSNLQSLRLQNLVLWDISFTVSLTRLEILDLQGSKFERIPNGIEKLKKLKLLDLTGCIIDECCYKVIGRCSQLEELYVPTHSPHSKSINCYAYLVSLMKLRRYKLEIGDCSRPVLQRSRHVVIESTRSLLLGQLNISMLGSIIKDLAQRATEIAFNELEGGSKSFMSHIVQTIGGMNELTKLYLRRCSEIECIIKQTSPHHEHVAMPRLGELELRDMDSLKQLSHGPSPFSLFQKLERLFIYNCPQLLHMFPADCNLGNIKFLSVSSCPKLTSLFPSFVACTLFSLEELKIERCSELKHVLQRKGGSDVWENSRFPKLKFLSIGNCDELEFVCPIFLALRFVQLEHLSIINAPKMKFMFDEGQPMHDQDEIQILFPLLEYLQLENLPRLVDICSERYHRRWPSIKTIDWRHCPNMEMYEVKGHQLMNAELYQPLASIERIQLDNCVAKSIFHCHIGVEGHIPTFQYLKELTLKKCVGLKFVFSAHICQSLLELTSMAITCCEELEAIFSRNEETQNVSIAESYLPKLKKLEISKCDKLKFILSLMANGTTSMLQQLSTVTITDCSQMEEVFKCPNIGEVYEIHSEREVMFPNMKDMKLDNLPRLVNVCRGFKLHVGEFYRVEVHDCPNFMPIKGAIVRWTEERLVREYVLKESQLNIYEALNVSLSVLNVGEVDSQSSIVEHNWRVIGDDEQEENNDARMLMRSEQQMVRGVVPTQILSFQYLHSLEVTQNKKLKFVFSKSTIVQNGLPKLASLTLSDCEGLEVIFGQSSEDDANSDVTIVLSSLRKIGLRNLPNFKSVCQGGLQFQMQFRDININNCPKFVDSSLGSALQQLGSIWKVWVEDSNGVETSSSNNENEEILLASVEQLYLEDSMNLMSMWEGPTSIIFQNLGSLSVIRCRRLKCMFSTSVIKSLPCLEELHIEECGELEEIIMPSSSEEEEEHHHHHHDHFPNDSSNPSLCFPKLQYLEVIRCSKLKWLFPSLPSTKHLPLLRELTIIECSQLKGLFNNNQFEIHEEEVDISNLLPFLICPTVEDCPIFSTPTLAALQSRREYLLKRLKIGLNISCYE